MTVDSAHLAELARLRAERDFLLARADMAGHLRFSADRDFGTSANALVRHAITGAAVPEESYPSDTADLAACFLARDRAPEHLHARMDVVLEQFRAHVATRHPEVARDDWRQPAEPQTGVPIDEFLARMKRAQSEGSDTIGPDAPRPTHQRTRRRG